MNGGTLPMAAAPDLNPYSTEVTTGIEDVPPGTTFAVSASVRNDGNGTSAATTVRFYRSTDQTIDSGDTQVGSDRVPPLASSGTSTHSADLTAPSAPGRILLRRLPRRGCERFRPNQRLFKRDARTGSGKAPRPDAEYAHAGPQRSPSRRAIPDRDSDAQPWGRDSADNDSALLPVGGYDDHEVGHASGHGRGGEPPAFGKANDLD